MDGLFFRNYLHCVENVIHDVVHLYFLVLKNSLLFASSLLGSLSNKDGNSNDDGTEKSHL